MNKRNLIGVVLILGLIFVGVFWESERARGAAKMTLVAAKVKKAPTGLDDPIWQKAEEIHIPLEGKAKFAEKKLVVRTRAVYTYEDLYFRFAWKDATRSVTKAAWQFDGQKWSHLEGQRRPSGAFVRDYPNQEFRFPGLHRDLPRPVSPPPKRL